MQRFEHVDKLFDEAVLVRLTTVECTFCTRQIVVEGSRYEGAEAAYTQGWRYIHSIEYAQEGIGCPDCVAECESKQGNITGEGQV